jgi:hypothetical protein
MTTATKTKPADIQDEVLGTIRSGQNAVIDVFTAWADAIKAITPGVPALSDYVSTLPKVDELVGITFDIAEKSLANQRQFTEKVLAVAAGLLPAK